MNFNYTKNENWLTHDEACKRYLQLYHGKTPRGRVQGNLNYYDHNILGLKNRIETKLNSVKNETMFDSITPSTKTQNLINV